MALLKIFSRAPSKKKAQYESSLPTKHIEKLNSLAARLCSMLNYRALLVWNWKQSYKGRKGIGFRVWESSHAFVCGQNRALTLLLSPLIDSSTFRQQAKKTKAREIDSPFLWGQYLARAMGVQKVEKTTHCSPGFLEREPIWEIFSTAFWPCLALGEEKMWSTFWEKLVAVNCISKCQTRVELHLFVKTRRWCVNVVTLNFFW